MVGGSCVQRKLCLGEASGEAGVGAQAALEALLFDGFEPFEDEPESVPEEPESLLAALDPLDDESDLDRSDALARAFAP